MLNLAELHLTLRGREIGDRLSVGVGLPDHVYDDSSAGCLIEVKTAEPISQTVQVGDQWAEARSDPLSFPDFGEL
jgi:hypothetical protein